MVLDYLGSHTGVLGAYVCLSVSLRDRRECMRVLGCERARACVCMRMHVGITKLLPVDMVQGLMVLLCFLCSSVSSLTFRWCNQSIVYLRRCLCVLLPSLRLCHVWFDGLISHTSLDCPKYKERNCSCFFEAPNFTKPTKYRFLLQGVNAYGKVMLNDSVTTNEEIGTWMNFFVEVSWVWPFFATYLG